MADRDSSGYISLLPFHISPIDLSLKEKLYLVALFGDISEWNRERLFMESEFPAQAGPLVMQAGYDFRDHLETRIAARGTRQLPTRKRRPSHKGPRNARY